MTIWDLNESPFLSTYEHSVKDFPDQILNDAYWAWEAPIVYWANTQKAEETLRLGVREFPDNRALQVFLAITLYNTQQHKEAMELVLVNLLETTSDEKLQYFKRGLLYYTLHLDETSQ